MPNGLEHGNKTNLAAFYTYLAQKIAMGVEQEVLVGTLKRALRIGGWFVLFDGLDEVPHDVKDVVASEVCHFVDDIVSENNCDLLTLCTSRPQGYSGQFSALDGPTIDASKSKSFASAELRETSP